MTALSLLLLVLLLHTSACVAWINNCVGLGNLRLFLLFLLTNMVLCLYGGALACAILVSDGRWRLRSQRQEGLVRRAAAMCIGPYARLTLSALSTLPCCPVHPSQSYRPGLVLTCTPGVVPPPPCLPWCCLQGGITGSSRPAYSFPHVNRSR
jgi:hypothetical protein